MEFTLFWGRKLKYIDSEIVGKNFSFFYSLSKRKLPRVKRMSISLRKIPN